MAVAEIKDLKKVIIAKASKGGGKGSPNQTIPPDVEIETIEGDEGEEESEEKDGDGQGEEKEEGQGEGKAQGNGEEGKEGEEGEGESEGKGKPAKGQGNGKSGQGSGGGDSTVMSKEQLEKKAQELIDKLNGHDGKAHACGSSHEREKKKGGPEESDIVKAQKEQIVREQIMDAINQAAEPGKEHPLRQSGSGRGTGKGSGAPQGTVITIQMRRPEFLDKLTDFAEQEFEKEYYKKGTDWVYSQAYEDIYFKDRPKVSIPQKSVYILVDVSGSMFGDFDGTGKSLLEHLIGYLPTIAEDFKGEVWWMSDGIIMINDQLGITPLSYFQEKTPYELAEFYEIIKEAEGTGGGTTFNVELQAIQNIRQEQGHMAPIICLTDGEIDNVKTTYLWEDKLITKGLPPNTIMMTDPNGIDYLKRLFNDDFEDPEKRIEYYDVTENGKYKSLK